MRGGLTEDALSPGLGHRTALPLRMDDREDDENRRAILARRARFITAAITGLVMAAGCPETDPPPQPCLDAPPPPATGGGGMGQGGEGGVGGESGGPVTFDE